MFLASRRIETNTCLYKNIKVKIWPQVKVTMQRSDQTLKCQKYPLLLGTDAIGQVDGQNTWTPAGYGLWPEMTLKRSRIKTVILSPNGAQDMLISKVTAQSGHYGRSYSVVRFFRSISKERSNLISGLRPPNKKILDMHFIINHELT